MPSLRCLSLNVWGVPIAPNRKTRFGRLATWIKENEKRYDVVCLQECFVQSDVRRVVQAAKQGGLTYAHVFRNGPGCWGSNSPGLVVLSRYRIIRARLLRYALSGKIYRLDEMDGMHGKAAGVVILSVPNVGLVNVYVTHLVACYVKRVQDDEYHVERMLQVRELAQFMRATIEDDTALAVLCGDLNAQPADPVYKYLMAQTPLRDTVPPCDAARPRPFATHGVPGNPYAVDHTTPTRLDYIMTWSPPRVRVRTSAAGLAMDLDTTDVYVSDHSAIFAVLEVSLDPRSGHDHDHKAALRPFALVRPTRLWDDTLRSMLKQAIQQCTMLTRWHRNRVFGFAVLAGCVYPCAPWLAPFLVALATVHLLIYGVYCGDKMSSLVQAHNEVALDLGDGTRHADQVTAAEMGDAFEFVCWVLSMGWSG